MTIVIPLPAPVVVLLFITIITVGGAAISERNDSGWMAGFGTFLTICANGCLWAGYVVSKLF